MTKKKLISKLNSIYGQLDTLPDDYTLYQVVKQIENLRDEVGNLVTLIEDDGIREEIEEKE